MRVAIIGGGAAGFFSALSVKQHHPKAEVFIFEKSRKFLSKVKVSGGGRCNVTNAETSISTLSKAYPRGAKLLKKAFREFKTDDTVNWFESRGVKLVTQEDNCIFPVSQDSQTVIDCFENEAKKLGIKTFLSLGITSLRIEDHAVVLAFNKPITIKNRFTKAIIASGGSPKIEGLKWLEKLGHQISPPVPSLFTFNMPQESVTELMGIVVENARVSIEGTKLNANGPLLITHWGMSGPAILVLSAFGARILNDMSYRFNIHVNWLNITNQEQVSLELGSIAKAHSKKILSNFRPFNLPDRLWQYLLVKAQLPENKRWGELGKKGLNIITRFLTHDIYSVEGKTTFKEEFVTCGGVGLESIDGGKMRSKVHPQLYFAGEVMDIDGITGGYNFQAAWTTAFIAGKLR